MSGHEEKQHSALGGKRAPGLAWQAEGRKVRRRDAARVRQGPVDRTLTAYAGLRDFAVFCRSLGLDSALREGLGHLKTGKAVV